MARAAAISFERLWSVSEPLLLHTMRGPGDDGSSAGEAATRH
jgi:hypothetical protein